MSGRLQSFSMRNPATAWARCTALIIAAALFACACAEARGAEPDEELPLRLEQLLRELRAQAATQPSPSQGEMIPVGADGPPFGPGASSVRRIRRSDHNPGAVMARSRVEVRPSAPSPMDILLLAAGLVSLLLLLAIWRRRRADPLPARVASMRNGAVVFRSSREIVALACDRCSRVVDVPRDRLAGELFCPRCGSRMPGAR